MKSFEFDPASYSKNEYFIGGVRTYVYNESSLKPYLQLINDHSFQQGDDGKNNDIPINVLYLAHYRGGDYHFTESIAYNILRQYYEKKPDDPVPLICVTFDNRNHGERLLKEQHNRSWKSGNDTHGVDMISMIRGGIDDLKLVMDYLPSYLNLEYHLTPKIKYQLQAQIKFNNTLSGYSQGAHTVIRFANKYPELVDILNPVVGCNDLSSLLLNRLLGNKQGDAAFDKKWFYFNYEEIPLSQQQQQLQYPEAFHNLLRQEDTDIFENFPFNKVKLFASFGDDDTLVPPSLSRSWVEMYLNTNRDSEVFVQKDIGHEATPEMIENFTSWLVKHT